MNKEFLKWLDTSPFVFGTRADAIIRAFVEEVNAEAVRMQEEEPDTSFSTARHRATDSLLKKWGLE